MDFISLSISYFKRPHCSIKYFLFIPFLFPQIISSILFTSQFTSPFRTENDVLGWNEIRFLYISHSLSAKAIFPRMIFFYLAQDVGDEKVKQAEKNSNNLRKREKKIKSEINANQLPRSDLTAVLYNVTKKSRKKYSQTFTKLCNFLFSNAVPFLARFR